MEDYITDGLLYCGKCDTPKQTRVTLGGHTFTPTCICKCERERLNNAEREKEQFETRLKIQRMRHEAFPETDMSKWTFRANERADKVSQIAHLYVNDFETMKEKNRGLLFYGGVGTGKTFLAACIVNALIDKQYACLMTSISRLVNTVSGMYSGKQEYIDNINQFDLLVIDDLGVERSTEFMLENVQNIIDSRYRCRKPLIVTTNLTAEELKHPKDIRKERIYSRLFEMCIPVEVTGSDRRKGKLKEAYRDFNNMIERKSNNDNT